jgi:hypothetical protein
MLHRTRAEILLLAVLNEIQRGTLEEVVALLPELGWNEVFHAVDSLSRRGDIVLRRHGFSYDVALPAMARKTA